jgi:hypothetical protein
MIDTSFDPDLDSASLRKEADLFERYAAHKRQLADLIELSCFTTMLSATDSEGRRGVDELLSRSDRRSRHSAPPLCSIRCASAPNRCEELRRRVPLWISTPKLPGPLAALSSSARLPTANLFQALMLDNLIGDPRPLDSNLADVIVALFEKVSDCNA